MESKDMPMGKTLQKRNGKMWNWSFSTSCCHFSLLPEETLLLFQFLHLSMGM